MFKSIVKHFGPEWGAAVMGTAALSIALQLASEVASPFSIFLYVGLGFYLLATLMFVTFLVPWTLRFFWYPEEIKKDFSNPIRGNFFPTMPITFILAGTGTNKLGPLLFGPSVAYHLSIAFFFLGATGIFIFGSILLRSQFLNKNLDLDHANFAWFIPPVSHLIIPVLGVCSMDVHWAETALAPWLYIISAVALGVGFFSFLFVGAAIWHRYIYASIPEGRLAATTMVAIAPTAIMTIFLIKFAEAVEATHGTLFGIEFTAIFPVIQVIASVLWGFSAWWLVITIIMFLHYLSKSDHPVAFSWWAYTFPFEAFVIATGLLAKTVATSILHPLLVVLSAIAIIFWVIVVFGTLKWLQMGSFFEIKQPQKLDFNPGLVLIGAVIVLIPFAFGTTLFATTTKIHTSLPINHIGKTASQKENLIQNNLQLYWDFYPDWRYKPLLCGTDNYLVFVFHYTNHSDFPICVTPGYAFTCQPGIPRSANEEIAAYIEDAVENALDLNEQTPLTFTIPAGETMHDIVAFEKPGFLINFNVAIKTFQNNGWRLHYENPGNGWINSKNELFLK